MEGFENGGDMSGFRSLNNSTSKRVLNLLQPVKLTVWKVMIERVTVVKFRVNYRGGNGAGCFEVKVAVLKSKRVSWRDWIIAVSLGCFISLCTSSFRTNWYHLMPSSIRRHNW